MHKDIYLDLEWFPNQQLYLIGYAYTTNDYGSLYDENLTWNNFYNLLEGVENIYVYGPDIGMLEKYFNVDIRNYIRCFNLLGIIKKLEPHMPSYKLSYLEEYIGIFRQTKQYKSNIWNLNKDWNNPLKKQLVIKYNLEDVVNLVYVKRHFFRKHNITIRNIDNQQL